MAKKRPEFSFPELERRGRNAILRSTAEVAAEEALLADEAGERAVMAPTTPPATTPPPPASADQAETQPGERSAAEPRASVRARTRAARTPATPSSVTERGAVMDQLRQKLRAKQHLSSYTFRFRPEELEQLDALVAELNQGRSTKLSKNDLIRLALGWLLVDHQTYGSASLVVEVTQQE